VPSLVSYALPGLLNLKFVLVLVLVLILVLTLLSARLLRFFTT
jgi:hypothetical protein